MLNTEIFTPDEVSLMMSKFLEGGTRLLEPSAGTGNLLSHIKGYDMVDTFEIVPAYHKELTTKYPQYTHNLVSFLDADIDIEYDAVIMNPPYASRQYLNDEDVKRWKTEYPELAVGKTDLYLVFLAKAWRCLKPGGRLVAIIPSSFLTSVSARGLREMFHITEVVDFGHEKIFEEASVYTCIIVVDKVKKSLKSPSQEQGVKLKDVCDIFGGIATLRDKIFIHKEPLFDEECWKPILKVSKNTINYTIYPPSLDKSPLTFKYLSEHKDELLMRDKGKNKGYEWWEYGRKQGLKIKTYGSDVVCYYISTLLDPDNMQLIKKQPMLFYSGLVIIPRIDIDIEETLTKNIHTIKQQSSKRSKGWINLSSNTLKNLKI